MHIDSYQFGKIVIDGATYSNDCLIIGGSVRSSWWRERGHLLSAEDLGPIIAAGPAILVVGCGASGMMTVTNDACELLSEHGIRLETLDTQKAVSRFNELSKAGANVAAALHLTC